MGGVIILPGITIESGCIIGAGSVVTKNCEANGESSYNRLQWFCRKNLAANLYCIKDGKNRTRDLQSDEIFEYDIDTRNLC